MIVRCGACRSQFEVPGPGRFGCPACGSVNNVGGGPSPGPGAMPPPGQAPRSAPGAGGYGQPAAPPPPPPPDPPSPRVICSECELSFIVGQIETATCPNCGAEVMTGWKDADD